MPTARSYHDACGIARALDVVGERWSLLIVRELLFGPQRFSELRQALANASSNVVSDRLRELEGRGVIEHHKLAPPSASWVYELTPWGRQLEPIVLALGDWGVHVPMPPPPTTLSPASVLIYLRSCARPDPERPSATVRVELGSQVWIVRTAAGRLTITAGDSGDVDAAITTDPYTFNSLIADPGALETGVSGGIIRVSGDIAVLRRLLGPPGC